MTLNLYNVLYTTLYEINLNYIAQNLKSGEVTEYNYYAKKKTNKHSSLIDNIIIQHPVHIHK